MANLYADLLNSIGVSNPQQSLSPSMKWSALNPSLIGNPQTLYGFDLNNLRSLGWTGGDPLVNNPIVSYDGGANGNAQTETANWSIDPAFQKWMDSMGYTYGTSDVAGDKSGRGTAYSGILDKNGQLVGSPYGTSYDFNDSNLTKLASNIPAAVALIGGANALGAFGGGGMGGADAAATGSGGEGAFLGGEGSMGLTAQEIQAGAGTGGLTGAAPAASTAGVTSPAIAGMTAEDAAKIGAIQGAAGQLGQGATFGIPNNVLGTGIAAGSSLLGGVLQNSANKDALDAQMKAAAESNALLKYMYDTQRQDQMPWMDAGKNALAKLTSLLNSGEITSKFSKTDFENDPGYKFGMDQGIKALNNSSAARGMSLSGAAIKGAEKFGQDYAGTKYNDAFNRFYTEKSNTLNPLFQMSGLGQNATNQVQQAGTNYANNTSNNINALGNANAASNIYRGNIYGNILANLGGLGYDYFNRP